MEALKAFLEVYFSLVFSQLYTMVIMYAVVMLNTGVYSWLIIAGFLAPPASVWFYVVKKRLQRTRDLLEHGNRVSEETMHKALEELLRIYRKS